MLNIVGITLSFLGTFLTIVSIMTTNYNRKGITWAELSNLGREFNKQSLFTIIGFILMILGYLCQIIVAYKQL